MRKNTLFVFVLVLASLLAACSGAQAPAGNVAPTQTAWVVTATPAVAKTQVETPKPTVALSTSTPVVVGNTLVNPELFDAGEDPAGKFNPGFFDIGVNDNQIGIVFGYNLAWGKHFVKGEGCEIVVLSGGWYENFEILDGRYEIYTLPSSDPTGWTKVLVEQRVAEQATHYECPADVVPPVWEGGK